MREFPAYPKSKQGCARQIDAVLRSYRRDFAGGGVFGYDWPTFQLNSPERYARASASSRTSGMSCHSATERDSPETPIGGAPARRVAGPITKN